MLHIYNKNGVPLEFADPSACKVLGINRNYKDYELARNTRIPFVEDLTALKGIPVLRGDATSLSRLCLLQMGLAFYCAYARQFSGTTRVAYSVLQEHLRRICDKSHLSDVNQCLRLCYEALRSVHVSDDGEYNTDFINGDSNDDTTLDTCLDIQDVYVDNVVPRLNTCSLREITELGSDISNPKNGSGIYVELSSMKGYVGIVVKVADYVDDDTRSFISGCSELKGVSDTTHFAIVYNISEFLESFDSVYNDIWYAILKCVRGDVSIFDKRDLSQVLTRFSIEEKYDNRFMIDGNTVEVPRVVLPNSSVGGFSLTTIEDVPSTVGSYLDVYNVKRIQSDFGGSAYERYDDDAVSYDIYPSYTGESDHLTYQLVG